MKKIFFTVGPSQLYPTVVGHIKKALKKNIPSISHRGDQFMKIYEETCQSLKRLLAIPKNYHIFFLGSSLESMERILQNCADKHSFHFIDGAFSQKLYQFSEKLGLKPEKVEIIPEVGFDFAKVKIPKKTELICLTHNETSSGMVIPVKEIYRLRKKYPKKLIAVDIVSSAPYLHLDFSKVDAAFFSGQKGFGLPAGLGVLIVSDRAVKKAKNVGTYHNFASLLKYELKNQSPETPNVLTIYLLGEVTKDMLKKGIAKIRKETEEKAKLIYDFFDKNKENKPFIQEKRFRSSTTIVINIKNGSKKVLKKLKTHGIVVGSGYGENKEKQIRIANFPSHSKQAVQKLLKFF